MQNIANPPNTLTIRRPFVIEALNEAWDLASQKAQSATKDTKAKEAKTPHAIQTSLLLINKLPELLKIKDERSEEDKVSNTNPYRYKSVEVKYVHFVSPNQIRFISDANNHQIVVLEFLQEEESSEALS